METDTDIEVQDDSNFEITEQSSNSVLSEGSTTAGGPARNDLRRASGGLGPAVAVGDLPAEPHFRQLASLHILRATFQGEEERGNNRLSLERVLQSAQRQNVAERVRLAFMQQQISDQLRITQAQERRMGELLHQLQGLNLQSANLAAHEDTVLEIIEDLNGVKAGNPPEVAGFLAEAASLGTGVETWHDVNCIPSFFDICGLFSKGQAASCQLQLSLPPFCAGLVSLQEMASCGRDLLFQILNTYTEAMKVQLHLAGSSDPKQAADGLARSHQLAVEFFAWRSCFSIGQPASFRPHWKSNMASAPLPLMQATLDQGRLRQDQLVEAHRQWQRHRLIMDPLQEAEQGLKATLRDAIRQASGSPDCQDQYLPMMELVSQLKANQAAQADCAVIFNTYVGLKVFEPLQNARMMSFFAPYQFRPDMMLLAGLMLPDAPATADLCGPPPPPQPSPAT